LPAWLSWLLVGCSKTEETEEVVKPTAVDITPAATLSTTRRGAQRGDAVRTGNLTSSSRNRWTTTSSGTAFIVKVHAVTAKGAEDLWLSSAAKDGDHYTAIVESDPTVLIDFPIGTEVRFSLGDVVEWHYFRDDKVIGAQVTRVLRQPNDSGSTQGA